MNRVKPLPSVERLRELLDYDQYTGVFRWKVSRRSTARAGSIAGFMRNGYRTIGIDRTVYMAHRIAWKMVTGKDPFDTIDHINHKQDDNRIDNLREATRRQQSQNRRAFGRSEYLGVTWNKKARKWQTYIQIDGKPTYLGLFACEAEAAKAYDAAAAKHHGEYANLNFEKADSADKQFATAMDSINAGDVAAYHNAMQAMARGISAE